MQIAFGTTITQKKLKKKAVINSKCAYTGKEFTKEDPATMEHIKPKKNGGSNTLDNMLVVTESANNRRGSMPFNEWLKNNPDAIKHIQQYLNDMREIKFGEYYEDYYVPKVIETLNREAKREAYFTGKYPLIFNKEKKLIPLYIQTHSSIV